MGMAFILALAFGLVLMALLVGIAGWGRSEEGIGWAAIGFAFVLLVLGIMAAGLWIRPAGPMYDDVFWGPMLFVGVLIALLLAAIIPPGRPPKGRPVERSLIDETERGRQADVAGPLAFGALFWMVLVLLVAAIALARW